MNAGMCRAPRRPGGASVSGFTLVEILIVVIILGILAAIVIPQFANASEDARKTNLRNQLQTLRGEVMLYRVEHRDILPDLIGEGWNPLMTKTDQDGNASVDPDDYGPYMYTVPTNPLNGLTTIAEGDGTAAVAGAGWVYDYNGGSGTGRFFATNADGATIFTD